MTHPPPAPKVLLISVVLFAMGCQAPRGVDGTSSTASEPAALNESGSAVTVSFQENWPEIFTYSNSSVPFVDVSALAGIDRVELWSDPPAVPLPTLLWLPPGPSRLVASETAEPGSFRQPFWFPYSIELSDDGPRVLRVVAYDTAGNTATAIKNILVDVMGPDFVALDKPPAENATVTNMVHLRVSGSDIETKVERFEIYDGVTLIGSGVGPTVSYLDWENAHLDAFNDGQMFPWQSDIVISTFDFDWDTSHVAPGAHTLQVVAIDTAGNPGYAYAKHLTVIPPTAPPVVAITAPAAWSPVAGTVSVTATATSNVALKGVDVFDNGQLIGSDDTAPYSVNWDTSELPEGPHALTAVARDIADQTTTSESVYILISHTPPALSVHLTPEPAGAGTVSGIVQVSMETYSLVGIPSINVLVDDVSIDTRSTNSFVLPWNTATVPNGTHSLKVIATDPGGLVTVWSQNLLVANIPNTLPLVAIKTPVEGAFIKDDLTTEVDASDPEGIDRVQWLDGGVAWATITTAPFAAVWNTIQLPEGPHTLTARAFDRLGNTALSAPVAVTIDRTAPVLDVTVAPGGSAGLRGTVQIQATASDDRALALVAIYRDGVLLDQFNTPPFHDNWDTTAAADGPHTVAARAIDKAGNVTDKVLAVVVNNSFPVTLDNVSNGLLVGKTVTLRAHTGDDRSVTSMSYYDGATAIATATAAPFEVTWTPKTAGNHSLTAQATAFGRVFTSPAIVVKADIEAPSVTLTSPGPGSVPLANVHLVATAADNTAVAKVDFYDGVILIGTELSAPYTELWNAANAPLGAHTLFARATDTAGNTTDSKPVNVTVPAKPDVTPPKVAITAPVKNDVAGASIVWAAAASDNVGVARIEFYDGSTRIKTIAGAVSSFVWNTSGVTAGSHKLTARAFDNAGNTTTSAIVTITIDHTAPSVSLTAPANKAKVSGNINITATASDNLAVARVEFSVAGVVRCSDAAAPYVCLWTVPAGAGRSYILQVTAYDTAGNTRSSATATVTAK